ncbi:MAG TPA: VOC family protein [Terriglobales bacterium]|nr:VOC family protein [Terriglobales bacterium]
MANPFVHVELNTPDPQKAKAFYSKLFQWQLEDMQNPEVPEGTYTLIKVGDGTGGGIMKQVSGGPSGWVAYALVDDIHATTEKAKSLGAEIMKDVTEVMGMGYLSFIRDPTGAILGLWQPKSK